MLTGTGVGSNFRFVADLELNETSHAPVAHPAIHPRTGRGDEARRALRSARAEPEYLETRVWGVSGPVRNRIKNRTEQSDLELKPALRRVLQFWRARVGCD